jgi:hypothetical protein
MNNSLLVAETKDLCKKETEINAQIIRNLTLIYERRIHLEMGYGSLFEFCTEELNLSPASAHRKIAAVKLSEAVPEIADKLEKGEISLSKVTQVVKFVREEKKHLNRQFTKTEVKNLVAAVQKTRNEFEAQKVLSLKSEMVVKPFLEKVTVVPGGRQTLQIEVDDELLDLLKQVRDLVSHEGFQTHSQLLKKTLKFFLSKKHPGHKAKAAPFPRGNEMSKNRRYIKAAVRQSVWQKNDNKCSFTDPITKKRCGSTFRLQIEHLKPIAWGGESIESNLTLYCGSHNLFAAGKLGLLRHHQGVFPNT